MKSHATVKEMAELYEKSDQKTRTALLKAHGTHGFKRPTILLEWEKFNIISGFSVDVMHQFDEGVTHYLLEYLMDPKSILYSGLGKTPRQAAVLIDKMDKKWMSIKVTGHNNREVRSLTTFKRWKAHELRFFIQHGAPFVLKDIIDGSFYDVYCLASCIAYGCTKDSISQRDIKSLRKLCDKFMRTFEDTFGVGEMKYSIHLVSHLWYAVELNGPLHIISCYGPEDQIGKVSRKVQAMHNTTKNIMNNAVILTDCTMMLESIRMSPETTDYRVLGAVQAALGVRSSTFATSGTQGTCRMLGKVRVSECEMLSRGIKGHLSNVTRDTIFSFKRAQIETGIFIRTEENNKNTNRIESLVMDDTGRVFIIQSLGAVLDTTNCRVMGTFVGGFEMTRTPDLFTHSGSERMRVPHIFSVLRSVNYVVLSTAAIVKQIVVLKDCDNGTLLVSPPSNRFRPT
jgi:hypothetical protein